MKKSIVVVLPYLLASCQARATEEKERKVPTGIFDVRSTSVKRKQRRQKDIDGAKRVLQKNLDALDKQGNPANSSVEVKKRPAHADNLTQKDSDSELVSSIKGSGRGLKKSKKSSNKSSGGSGSGDGREDTCTVTVENLTNQQWFSDFFYMVHSNKIVSKLFEFNEAAFSDLAVLAQDGDPDELVDFYETNDMGVFDVDDVRGPVENGESIDFDIDLSDTYNRFTMATSFVFANDAFIAINSERIRDGDVFYLEAIDAGVETNTQLCWTVQATSDDFPENSDCADIDDDIADENDNQFPGEGFVHVHRGIQDLEERDVEELLEFTCTDLDADSFAEYFREAGFDDDELLFDDDRNNNLRDDESFIDFVEANDDRYQDIALFEIAVDAGTFALFCEELEDLTDFIFDALETLEPEIFDWRNPVARVTFDCD